MTKIPESMVGELGRWNDGKGIDLESWVRCEGSFSLAVGYATVFWPDFVQFEGYILRDGFSPASLRGFEAKAGGDRKAVEVVMNRLHVYDMHHHAAEGDDISKDKVILLGEVLEQIYAAKGVPSYRLLGASGSPLLEVWGQDRLWLVAREIRRYRDARSD